VTIATATGATDATGLLNLNVPNIVAPEPLACWAGFTPDILPGDTVTVADATTGTNSIIMPDFTVDRPSQVGSTLVLHGTAADPITGAPLPAVDGVLTSKINRFSVGTHGKAELSISPTPRRPIRATTRRSRSSPSGSPGRPRRPACRPSCR